MYHEIEKCPKCGERLYIDGYPPNQELRCLACGFRTSGRGQNCRVCGKEFIARKEQLKRTVVCCSISCAMQWQYETGRKKTGGYFKLARKECAWCGVLFKPRLGVQRFCSVKCAMSERMNRVKKLTPWLTRACFICGSGFKIKKSQVDAGHGLLCSSHCRNVYAAWVTNQKRWGTDFLRNNLRARAV